MILPNRQPTRARPSAFAVGFAQEHEAAGSPEGGRFVGGEKGANKPSEKKGVKKGSGGKKLFGDLEADDAIKVGSGIGIVKNVTTNGGDVSVEIEVSKSDGSKRTMSLTKSSGDALPSETLARATMGRDADSEAMTREQAVEVVTNNVRPAALDGWFRNEDKNFKPEITEAIHANPELRDAALNVFRDQYEKTTGGTVSHEEFMATEVTLYRGSEMTNDDSRDTFASYSMDRATAEKFGDDIQTIKVFPGETYGSMSTTGEAEVMIPIDLVTQSPSQ
jgi:hypothetical protein